MTASGPANTFGTKVDVLYKLPSEFLVLPNCTSFAVHKLRHIGLPVAEISAVKLVIVSTVTGFILSSDRDGRLGGKNLHLGFGEFSRGKVQMGDPNHRYVSLGESPSDWLRAVESEARKTYNALLKETAEYLSDCHSEKFTVRQAEILTGHIAKAFAWRAARANSQIKLALQLQPRAKMLGTKLTFATPRSTREALDLVSSPEYGGHLETVVYKQLSKGEAEIIQRFNETPSSKAGRLWSWQSLLLSLVGKTLGPVTKSQSYAIIGGQLGFRRETLLNLRLGQLPILRSHSERALNQHMSKLDLADSALGRPLDNRQPLVREFLRLVPAAFVEGHKTLRHQIEDLAWPHHPKVIFTSVRFTFDDAFKHYLCQKLSEAKYWVGQHGNNYFTSRELSMCPELATADKVISWGHKSVNTEPYGLFIPSKLRSHFSNRGVALVLQSDLPSRTYCDWDFREAHYLDAIEELVGLLSQANIKTILCLAPGTSPNLEQLICDRLTKFGGVSISSKPLTVAVSRKMMPVFTYDSTGMLELATREKPFIAFLPEKLGHVNRDFLGQYHALRSEGFLGLDAKSTFELITTNLGGFSLEKVTRASLKFTRSISHRAKSTIVSDLAESMSQV